MGGGVISHLQLQTYSCARWDGHAPLLLMLLLLLLLSLLPWLPDLVSDITVRT
jgi:hypothetical protein